MADIDEKKLEELVQKMGAVADQVATLVNGFSKIADNVKDVQKATEDWHGSMAGTAEVLTKSLTQLSRMTELQKELNVTLSIENIQRAAGSEMEEIDNELLEKQLHTAESLYSKMKEQYEIEVKTKDEVDAQGQSRRRTLDETLMALTNIQGAASKALQSVGGVGNIGLISLLFWGMSKESEFRAQANSVTQIFDVVGGHTAQLSGYMTNKIEDFQANMNATTEDLMGVAHAFADVGMNARQAFDLTGRDRNFLKEMGFTESNIGMASLALDKLFEKAGGSFARLLGAAVRDLGNEVHTAMDSMVRYGFAAEKAGQNTFQFMQSAVETAQQLKLYGIQLEGVLATQLKLVETNRTLFGPGREQFAGAVAQGQMGAIVGGIGGMSQGLAAYIGQGVSASLIEIARAGGKQADVDMLSNLGPIGAMREMGRGFRELTDGTRDQVFLATVEKLGELGARAGPDKYKQEMLLTGLGMPAEAATAIVQTYGEIQHMREDGKKVALGTDVQLRIQEAFKSESDKTSDMVKMIKSIEVGITQVVAGTLGLIFVGIRTLIDAVMAIWSRDARDRLREDVKTIDILETKWMEGVQHIVKGLGYGAEGMGLGLLFHGSHAELAKTREEREHHAEMVQNLKDALVKQIQGGRGDEYASASMTRNILDRAEADKIPIAAEIQKMINAGELRTEADLKLAAKIEELVQRLPQVPGLSDRVVAGGQANRTVDRDTNGRRNDFTLTLSFDDSGNLVMGSSGVAVPNMSQ